jgi:GT2 family glycosyltransferase
VCGPYGISTRDLREFHESAGPAVDAIEGYLMAFRRELLPSVGLFDERFAWYRTADVEWSFRVRDAGYRAVVVDLPVTRHEHRMWQATDPEERTRLSKRNYNRFLDRFRGRFDLLVEPPESR